MTVIELGDVTSGSAPRTAPEFDRRTRRRLAAVLVVLLCLITVTASARPEPSLVQTLWGARLASDYRFTAGGGSVVATTEPGVLSGYDLDTGRRRWTFPLPEPNSWPDLAASAGVVLLSTDRLANRFLGADGTQYLAEYYRGTVGLDLRDGRQLWAGSGSELAQHVNGTVLMGDYVGDGSTVQSFRVVRARDGTAVWSGPAGPAVTVVAAGADPHRPDRVIAIAADGTASVYAWADGRRLAHRRIAWTPSAPGAGTLTDVFGDGVNVYVWRAVDGAGGSVAAYRRDDLRPRWTAENAAEAGAFACGVVICELGPGGFAAVDPLTGRTLWRQVGPRTVHAVGGRSLLAQDGEAGPWTLYDARTGEVRARIGLGFPVRDSDTDEVLLTTPTEDPPMRTAVSRVDVGTGERSLRGTVDRVGDLGCALTDDHLICSSVGERLSISRIAP